jgi:DNA-binding SARP family transcriptional activator/tetratricopeptide (TPR) repeat protein
LRTVELRLLGPVELDGPDGPVVVGAPKERALLAYLGLHANHALSEDALVDALWADEPPRTATRTLQAYLSRLRKLLADAGSGQVRGAGAPRDDGSALSLDTQPGGWVLRASGSALDVTRVESLLDAAKTATERGDSVGAALTMAEALRCWRGRALAEFADSPWAIAAAVRLEELRLHVIEERIDAELACGRHQALAGELDALCSAHPMRERLWGQRMVALYRSGRQAEALRVYQALRATLGEELGIEPSPALARLEQRILEQDPDLELSASHLDLLTPDDAPRARAVGDDARDERVLPAAFASLRERAFVGRGDELTALDAAWTRARSGQLEVVLLAGEPGIGKTTLAVQQAAAAWASGAVVLFGRCDEESLAPFQPFVEALAHYVEMTSAETLRSYLGSQAADLALLVPQLGRVLPEVAEVVPTGAETERYRLFEVVPSLLRCIGADAPVLLILDDLHWADRPTLQLLQHVIRRGSGSSMLVIGTYRDTDLVRTHPMAEALADMRRANLITRVPLRGLSRDDVVAMVAGGAEPDAADRALGDALWGETEGSPLFLREILRHLGETGVIARDESGRWRAQRRMDQLGIPEGVREVIGRRLTRLSDDANAALRAGSVMGREVRVDVLERVTDLTPDQLLDALDEATSAGVVDEVPGRVGRYAFTHALVRQALYDELSITRRVRLHQRVGEALEVIHGADAGPHLAELAFHFAQSAVAGTADKAVDFGRRAAEHAQSLVAYEDAARHYATALEVAEDAGMDAPTRADLLLALGDCIWHAGDSRSARSAFDRAIDVGGDDPDRFARAALGYAGAEVRAMWVEIAFPNERGIALLEAGLVAIGPDDSDLRARLLACLAQELTYVAGTDDRRAELSNEAIAMARRLDAPATLAVVLTASNLADYSSHSAVERAAKADEAIALAEMLGDRQLEAHALFHRFAALAERAELDDATVALERATAVYDEIKDPVGRMLCPAFWGGLALLEGRFTEAQALFDQSFYVAQEASDRNGFVCFAGGVATMRFYEGRAVELMGLIDEGAVAFPAFAANIVAMRAGMLAELGQLEAARDELDESGIDGPDRIPRDPFWAFTAHLIARGCLRLGDTTRATWLYEMLAPFAGQTSCIGWVGWGPIDTALGWCAETLGRLDDAEKHYEDGIAICDRWGWRAPLVDAQLFLAALLSQQARDGDADRALGLLAEALPAAADIGMAGVVRDGEMLRDRLLGREDAVKRSGSRGSTRRERVKAKLSSRSRAAMARWTRGDTDEELVRRFSHDLAQRALFAGMVRGFQPSMSFGFTGEVTFELRPPDDELDPAAADWWTIEVRGRKATARRGRSEHATTTVSVGLADFVRLSAGELHPLTAIIEGLVHVTGDVMLASRLGDMFGAVEPIEIDRVAER